MRSPPKKPCPFPRVADLRRRLLTWYHAERRRMPWREKPSPYRTVVSEFMLQQTQVAAVIPYFEKFVRKFPGFPQLALADGQDVLAEWSGLGYYRRARFLKQVAEAVVHRHGGKLPGEAEALRALPGFGEYTTAAVGSIALGLPLACVDGNVRRVVSRLMKWRDPKPEEVAKTATDLLERHSPGDWNQAMMELGAVVCLPRNPRCLICPIRDYCRAFASGNPESYPEPKAAPKSLGVEETAVAVRRADKILVLQRALGGAFGGMWELPRMDTRETKGGECSPADVLAKRTGIRARAFREIGSSKSVFTHHRILTRLFTVNLTRPAKVRLGDQHTDFAWVGLRELTSLGTSGAQKKLVQILIEKREI